MHVERHARRAADKAGVSERGTAHGSPLHRLGQVGYAAQGLVWVVVGVVALLAARGGDDTQGASTSGALERLYEAPLGVPLLAVMAVGLVCYAAWQAVEAAVGHRDKDGGKRTAKRVGSGGKAVMGLALVGTAVGLILGSHSSGNREEEGAGMLLSMPGGALLLGIVGVGVIALGGYWIYSGVTEKFTEKLSGSAPQWVTTLGRAGYIARGTAFGVLGLLVILAAWRSDPSEAGGTSSAFDSMLQLPAGPWILGAVAIGLMAFGAFQIAAARHLREG